MKLLLVLVGLVAVAAQTCVDKNKNCPGWKSSCSQWWMRDICPKTCIVCTDGNGGNKKCGVSNVQQSRVINGKNAQPGAWPWIASLQKNGRHFCGGTLISPTWVLTASHCVVGANNDNLSAYTVTLGAQNIGYSEEAQQKIRAKRVIVHPMYNNGRRIMENDVALIELETPAKLNKRVKLGCLPKSGTWPEKDTQCYIAGWGTMTHPGGTAKILQQAKLPVVSRGHKGCHYNKNMVCVGLGFGSQPDGKQHPNACRGDSGGPLVCQKKDGSWLLEGVASYVYTYCKYYTAYTPVNRHIEFIKSYVKN